MEEKGLTHSSALSVCAMISAIVTLLHCVQRNATASMHAYLPPFSKADSEPGYCRSHVLQESADLVADALLNHGHIAGDTNGQEPCGMMRPQAQTISERSHDRQHTERNIQRSMAFPSLCPETNCVYLVGMLARRQAPSTMRARRRMLKQTATILARIESAASAQTGFCFSYTPPLLHSLTHTLPLCW